MKRIPIVTNDFTTTDMLRALLAAACNHADDFTRQLASFLNVEHCLLTASGFAALQIVLETLHTMAPERTEVILPAYAPAGLLLPITTAGLTPRLCDVTRQNFLPGYRDYAAAASPRTLAVIAPHLFGIPVDIPSLREHLPAEIAIIDDCAQSLGSTFNRINTGALAPIGIGSFGRGKNFSLYTGGFISMTATPLRPYLEAAGASLPQPGSASQLMAAAKATAFSAVTEPMLYGCIGPALRAAKPTTEKTAYAYGSAGTIIPTFAAALFPVWRAAHHRRHDNGTLFMQLLAGLHPAIQIPEIPPAAAAAFNRFPVLVSSVKIRERLRAALWNNGIEASVFYGRPVHHIVPDLGYAPDRFPEARYVAEHLLTLPVHGRMTTAAIEKTARIIAQTIHQDGTP